MKIKYQNKTDIPEGSEDSFVEFEENGATVWAHKDYAAAMRQQFRLKGDLTETQSKLSEMGETVRTLKEAAEQREADEMKDQGRYKEVAESWEKKYQTDTAALQEQIDTLTSAARTKDKNIVVKDLGAMGTESTRKTLERLIAQDLDTGEDGSIIVLEDGKASSTTLEQYKARLPELYPALIAEVPSSGGHAKGGNFGGSGAGKKWADYTAAELSQIRSKNPTEYERLKGTRTGESSLI